MPFWTKDFPRHMLFRYRMATVEVGQNIYAFFVSDDDATFQVYSFSTITYRWRKHEVNHSYDKPYYQDKDGYSAVSYKGRVYFFGGRYGLRDRESLLFCFDTEANSWSRPPCTGTIPQLRSRHSACVVGSKMLVYGGISRDGTARHLSSVFSLDLDTMEWRFCCGSTHFHLRRYNHTATAWGNYMIIFGGFHASDVADNQRGVDDDYYRDESSVRDLVPFYFYPDSDESIGDNEVVNAWSLCFFDTETDTWSAPETTGDRPEPRVYHAAFAHDGKFFVFAGQRNWQKLRNDLFVLDLSSLCWTRQRFPQEIGIVKKPSGYGRCGDRIFIFFFSDELLIDLDCEQFSILDLNASLQTLSMDKVRPQLAVLTDRDLPRHLLAEMKAIFRS